MYLPIIRKIGRIKDGALITRTISLGINPSKGGRPPKESRSKARIILFFKVKEIEEERSLGVLIFKAKNISIRTIRWSM
jgi:hypothetical protein